LLAGVARRTPLVWAYAWMAVCALGAMAALRWDAWVIVTPAVSVICLGLYGLGEWHVKALARRQEVVSR
jgi:hypothetical protein